MAGSFTRQSILDLEDVTALRALVGQLRAVVRLAELRCEQVASSGKHLGGADGRSGEAIAAQAVADAALAVPAVIAWG